MKTPTPATCGRGTEWLLVLHLVSWACKYLGIAVHHGYWGFSSVKETLLSCLQLFYAHNLQIQCNTYLPLSGFLMYLLCSAKADRPSGNKARFPEEKTIRCWYSVKSCLIVLCTSSPQSNKTTSLWRPVKKITPCCWILEIVKMIYSIQPYETSSLWQSPFPGHEDSFLVFSKQEGCQ